MNLSESDLRRRTKIVATLGPATDDSAMIEKLINLGVNVFRLNFSHGDHEYHRTVIQRVREITARRQEPVAILQDISGPKIRVGQIDGIMLLEAGDHLELHRQQPAGDNGNRVTISHPEVLDVLKEGDHVYFADGTIHAQVEKNDPEKVTLRVLVGAKLTSRKGLNLPMTNLNIPTITRKDRADIRFGIEQGVDIIALSFVRSAADIREAKRLIADAGAETPVFAKIEKSEAIDCLDDIIAIADGVMIARGDLGVELGVEKVPVLQKRILRRAGQRGIPVITATQMLTSMITSPYPTRAEVSDIANAVLDGTDAVMLSDETAMGSYPEEAIGMLVRTITETEVVYPWYRELPDISDNRKAIAAAAVALSQTTGGEGVVSFTESGLTALMVARHRPRTRIIASTTNPRTFRQLAVVWGVEPFFADRSFRNSDEAIYNFFRKALAREQIEPHHTFVVTIGRHSNRSGSTNLIQLLDRECIETMELVYGEPSVSLAQPTIVPPT
jgi:pyruvate kinase